MAKVLTGLGLPIGYSVTIALRALLRVRDPILPSSEFSVGMQFGMSVYKLLLTPAQKVKVRATPYQCVRNLVFTYDEEVRNGHLAPNMRLRKYILSLDQGTLGSHACTVLKKIGDFDIDKLREMSKTPAVIDAIHKKEDIERLKMGSGPGRLLSATRAYRIGELAIGPRAD
jgi:hypothetical protein